MRKVLVAMLGGSLMLAEGGYMTRAQEVQQDSSQKSFIQQATESTSPTEAEKKPALDSASKRQSQVASQSWLFKATGDFVDDQKQIWTSPAKLRLSDSEWLLPLSGIMAGLFVTDSSFNRSLSSAPTTINDYKRLSNAGVVALAGGAGGMWLLSHASHNPHWRETGYLSAEAALNSLVMVEGMKYALRRERPLQGDGNGTFFKSGGTSFPSEHSAAAWSIAGVIAHEYPGPLTKIMAYGLASVVTFSRVKGQQHFPSDVLAGTVLGNLVAQNVYSRRHDPELGGAEWQSLQQVIRNRDHTPANQGSPYVPLDSWIYTAMDRLVAMGVVRTAFQGMRPWTRSECRRLLEEGELRIRDGVGGDQAERLFNELQKEFASDGAMATGEEDGRVQVESIYARVTNISGEPLTDGNHFGQTVTDDFGRPYQRGFNTVEGFSAWTSSGRIVAYVRAEYQHSPSAPPFGDRARQFIASVDGIPVAPDSSSPAVNRAELLDAYVGMNFQNWQVTYGRQSLWWSPMHSGPLMFSDNATPINMFRVNRVSPFKLPWILGWLGEIRAEWFLGQLAGHQFVNQADTGRVGELGLAISRQPFLQGQKISFKPTANLEFSISSTSVFSGGPSPLTMHTFLRSYSFGNALPGEIDDPGDRRSGVDWTYRIPRLRDRLTFYGEAFTEDEFSPIGYPRKSAFQVGLYLSRIPGVAKMDFRAEGGTTVPVHFPGCVGCYYINPRYPDGSYINDGTLIGSTLGRAGYGHQAWTTYHLSARSSVQLSYRHQKVDGHYLPSGGTLNDAGISVSLQVRPTLTFSGSAQYEQWNYPLLSPTARSNVTSSIGLIFSPRNWILSKASE